MGGAFAARVAGYLAELDNERLEKPFDSELVRRRVAGLVAAAHGEV